MQLNGRSHCAKGMLMNAFANSMTSTLTISVLASLCESCARSLPWSTGLGKTCRSGSLTAEFTAFRLWSWITLCFVDPSSFVFEIVPKGAG